VPRLSCGTRLICGGGGVRVLRLRRHAGVPRRSALLQGWEPGLRLLLSSYWCKAESAWLAQDSDVHNSAGVDQDALMSSVLPSRLLPHLASFCERPHQCINAIARSLRAIHPSCEEESTGTESKWLNEKWPQRRAAPAKTNAGTAARASKMHEKTRTHTFIRRRQP